MLRRNSSSEICASPNTDEWLRLKNGALVELPSDAQLLVIDDGGTLRVPRNQVAFDIFCETWKVL